MHNSVLIGNLMDCIEGQLIDDQCSFRKGVGQRWATFLSVRSKSGQSFDLKFADVAIESFDQHIIIYYIF